LEEEKLQKTAAFDKNLQLVDLFLVHEKIANSLLLDLAHNISS